MVRFTVLSENRDNCGLKGEAGLSLLVEVGEEKFLLDAGFSDLFLKNAKSLGIDVEDVKTVIFTHGHSDHTNGIVYLKKPKNVIMHPAGFKARWSIRRKEFAGFPEKREDLEKKHNLLLSSSSVQVFPDVYFLGEIPMNVDFESNGNFATTLDANFTQTDFTEDDSGIAIKTEKGLVVMVGCGHRGICNALEHAKQITGENRIFAVLGGFHLRKLDDKKTIINKTIEYLNNNGVQALYLGHCISDDVIDYFEQVMEDVKIFRLGVGKKFDVLNQKEENLAEALV